MKITNKLSKKEIIDKIKEKKEFSQLPEEDVERVYEIFEKRQDSEEEKIRLTRELLHKIFGAFGSKKILSPKDKSEEWMLRKHLSTRERIGNYKEIYSKLLKGNETEKIKIFDLGAGINGFSYKYLKEINPSVKYVAIEAVGQFVDLSNSYFEKKELDAEAFHLSLFELERIKNILKKSEEKKILFLLKVIDALEIVERDYSKKLIRELSKLVDRIVISFPTRSMKKRKRFNVDRSWILDFIEKDFKILDDFEIAGERYISFE